MTTQLLYLYFSYDPIGHWPDHHDQIFEVALMRGADIDALNFAMGL